MSAPTGSRDYIRVSHRLEALSIDISRTRGQWRHNYQDANAFGRAWTTRVGEAVRGLAAATHSANIESVITAFDESSRLMSLSNSLKLGSMSIVGENTATRVYRGHWAMIAVTAADVFPPDVGAT